MNEAIKEACERSIALAADGVAKLRVTDVMRVMEDFFYGAGNFYGAENIAEMVAYISANRPDLAAEANACQLELTNQTQPDHV